MLNLMSKLFFSFMDSLDNHGKAYRFLEIAGIITWIILLFNVVILCPALIIIAVKKGWLWLKFISVVFMIINFNIIIPSYLAMKAGDPGALCRGSSVMFKDKSNSSTSTSYVPDRSLAEQADRSFNRNIAVQQRDKAVKNGDKSMESYWDGEAMKR